MAVQLMTEADILAQIVCYLRTTGWLVKVFAQDKATRQQLSGWVDVAAFRQGVTLLVECKRPGGKRRVSQAQFAEAIREHLWSTLLYVLASDVADVAKAVGDGCI